MTTSKSEAVRQVKEELGSSWIGQNVPQKESARHFRPANHLLKVKKKTSNFCQTRTLTNIRNYNRQLAWASVLPQEDQGALLEDFALTDRGAENSDQIKYEES